RLSLNGWERGRTMVDQAAAREIFEHELAALTDAEEKTAEVLGKIVPQVHSLKLQQLLANYQQVSAGQVKRLADIFKLLKVTPEKAPSAGVDGLIRGLRFQDRGVPVRLLQVPQRSCQRLEQQQLRHPRVRQPDRGAGHDPE